MTISKFIEVLFLFVYCPLITSSFYLPGIAPVNYCKNGTQECQESAAVFVNRLNSPHTLIPYEYERYDLCQPSPDDPVASLNLGQILFGDRIRRNSLYKLEFNKSETCKEVCVRKYAPKDLASGQKLCFLKKSIGLNYHQHWIMDNMPVTWCYQVEAQPLQPVCEGGFPLGCYVTKSGKKKDTCVLHADMNTPNTFYLYNHVDINIKYHRNEDDTKITPSGANIISAKVNPRSILYNDACVPSDKPMGIPGLQWLDKELTIRYTYSVTWTEDAEHKWASRWDYILESMPHSNIQWFSIINTRLTIAFTSAALVGIVLKSLKHDIALSNELKSTEDDLGKYDKWRLLHGDVFRPPRHGMILSALAGNGAQVLFMTVLTIQFAVFGMLSPANRGALGTCALILFAIAGFPAGVASARVYKRFGGEKWKTNAMVTALLFPGIMYVAYLIQNITYWSQGSSAAVPITMLLALLGLWIGASLPLTFIGAFLGQRKGEKLPPSAFNEKPRPIPARSFFVKIVPGMIVGGILPFGCIFIESFFVMNSIWKLGTEGSGLQEICYFVIFIGMSGDKQVPQTNSINSVDELTFRDSYDQADEMPMVEVPSSSRASTPGPKRQRNETRDTGFQVNVLMRLTNIEQKMEEQISMMRSVFSSLSLNIEEEEDVFPEPLDSEEELMEFEQRLSNKPYKKKMILYLSSLGGHDMGDSIRRMLRKIGTNKLWSSYSLKGRKNAKKPFQNLKLASVIKKAYLRSNPKASEKDIEDKISGTLKGAPFKKGGVLTVVPADISMVTEARREDTSEDEN